MDRLQASTGLASILSPRSLVVVGASARPGTVGHSLLASILGGGFRGTVLAVNPHEEAILGVPCWPDVASLPETPELAVVAVPAAAVVDVAQACGRKGVKGLIVVSAGFREADEEGARREEALRAVVQRYGMRMVGPNCLGVVNADPAVRLHATFAPRPMRPGTTALVTQSGAVGIALLEHAAHVGLGVARFVSMGNKTDVSGNDLLLLWEHDPDVQQVLLYLENFGNPRNFVRIARRLARTKSLVVLKAGRTASGARAAGSHTGALMQSDDLVDALLAQCGVLRADTVDDLFDVAAALATQPPMPGPRIAIVTNSGGPAILAVDRLATVGLEAATFTPATTAALGKTLPAASHAANPVDLLASGTPQAFESAVRAVTADPNVDGLLVIWTPIRESDVAQAAALARVLRPPTAKPCAVVVFGHGPTTPAFQALADAGIPTYSFPEHAVASLGALHHVAQWRARPVAEPEPMAVDGARVRAVLAQARTDADGWLSMQDAFRLVDAYGIPLPRHAFVDTPAGAATAATALGFPVVLKAEVPGVVHKTEAGAVRMGLRDAAEVERACAAMQAAATARGQAVEGFLVMATAPDGPEVLVGAVQDPTFGPVVACGAGGVYTEILRDVRFRLAPLALEEAREMLDSLRVAPLLAGARGGAPRDAEALAEAVTRLAQLAADVPEVREVELNPVRALDAGDGVMALDARVRLQTQGGRQPAPLRS